ncbi:MAG: hypothetical protein GX600_07380 [Dehalococcoidia bacterium]|nr:hypothetical protein [Dehalococcoidia bacterium]
MLVEEVTAPREEKATLRAELAAFGQEVELAREQLGQVLPRIAELEQR